MVNIERIKNNFEALPIRDDIFEEFWQYFLENESYFLENLESDKKRVLDLIKEGLNRIKQGLEVEISRKYEISFSSAKLKENFEYLKRIKSAKPNSLKWIINIIE